MILKTYIISTEVTGADVNPGKLHGEIMASGHVNNFAGVLVNGDILSIVGDSLSNETSLDSLITGHDTVQTDIELDYTLFGSEYHYAEGELESTTTSESYAAKVLITTSDLPEGNYLIEWTAETQNTSTNGRTEIQILVDGIEVGNTSVEAEDNRDWQSHSGFKETSLSGINNIILNWRRQNGGTSKIRRARIKLIRIG